MKLPDVRNELQNLATALEIIGHDDLARRLAYLAEQTRRRSPMKRAEPRAKPMSAATKDKIRQTAKAHPDWANREIALAVGVDGGRVSEVLRGFRQ